MDRQEKYKEIVKELILDYAKVKPAYGEIENEVVFDEERGHYELKYGKVAKFLSGVQMLEIYRALLNKFTALLQREYGAQLISVVLYGSVARGDARKDSDVDIIIVLEAPPVEYYKRTERVRKVLTNIEKTDEWIALNRQGYQPYIKPIVFSKAEAEEPRYLFLDIVEDGIILYDNQGFFARRLERLRKRLTELGSKRVFLEDGSWYWLLKLDLKRGEVFEI